MAMVKKFEGFLRRLDVLGYEVTIIPPDWPDYEEWMWTMYRKRVMEHEAGASTIQASSETKDERR